MEIHLLSDYGLNPPDEVCGELSEFNIYALLHLAWHLYGSSLIDDSSFCSDISEFATCGSDELDWYFRNCTKAQFESYFYWTVATLSELVKECGL